MHFKAGAPILAEIAAETASARRASPRSAGPAASSVKGVIADRVRRIDRRHALAGLLPDLKIEAGCSAMMRAKAAPPANAALDAFDSRIQGIARLPRDHACPASAMISPRRPPRQPYASAAGRPVSPAGRRQRSRTRLSCAVTITDRQSALKRDPGLEWAPAGGQESRIELTGARASGG